MLNMSNQFYDYLSNKLLNHFKENNILSGERFFISFDEDNQVLSFYSSLKKVGESNLSTSNFSFTHNISGKEYSTYAININGIKLVVSESLNVNVDFLVTLRNQVTSQEGVWENTALLVICTEGIDSIYNGMRDLQKEGMPLNVKSISNNLEDEINNSTELTLSDKQIAIFSLTILEDDIFQTTLWDYETILSIINKGRISDDDLKDLNLFKDDQLKQNSPAKMDKRLRENYETFNEVNKFSQYGDKKEQLKKMFTTSGVSLLSKDDWYTAEWRLVKKSKDDFINQNNPLEYIESHEKVSENGLIFWERPNSYTKAGKRKRNIIVFNNNSSSEVTLKFTFDQPLSNSFLNPKSKEFAETRGKSIYAKFSLDSKEPTFKSINYKHKNESSSDFTFNIVVLSLKPELIDTIKSRYGVNFRFRRIEVTNDEDSYDVEFGNENSKKIEKFIEKDGEKVDLYDDESIIISEQSPAWENGKLSFILSYYNYEVPFLIKEKSNKTLPVDSYVIWNLKRRNMENFIFNGKKAVQDVNSFYLMEEFKEFLRMEREIIKRDIFYAKRNIDGSLEKIDVSFCDELEKAYLDIFNYYKTFDDSPEDNLPSLVYLNDDLKELYKKFISIFNKEISEIEENSILSDYEDKKNLLKLGRIITDNKIMYSPLSPLNIAYQLEVAKQCKNEDLSVNILERLVPNNLIPYICSDDGKELYRPIYQEEAHEWLIYEKSEEVSIGTTNVFISNVVTEKLNQFVKHFNYLFSFNNASPIKINLINIKDDKEVVKGVFNFIRARLPDKTKTKKVIPVEINIYNDADRSYFDNLFDCQSEIQLMEEFGIKKLKSDIFDPIDVIHMVQDDISYFKHPFKKEQYEYAHLSFYKVKSHNNIANDNMDKIETGLSLNGLLSSVTSTTKHSEYRTGFGTNNILNMDNPLIQTVINLNELVENSKNFGKNTYSKNKSVITTVELEEDNIEELYDKSHWVTFIEPTFGIEYFDSDNDLIIIHYSDQYSSSSKYDTITVTNKSTQYEEIIRDFLHSKNVSVTDEELYDVIKMFNAINGEWLLRIISNSGHYDREKLSIISAIKYCLAILDHKDIVWIPVSMEEILRIAGNVKLDKNKGIFDSKLIKGNHSDDLLFIGVKFNEDNRIELIFYPVEVKIGLNHASTIKKGKNQLDNTYKLLKNELRKINVEDSEFRNKFFRNFFIQLLLSNEQKLVTNHIWDEKRLNRIEEFKAELLNDEYDIIYGLEEFIGKGSLVSFKNECHHITIYRDVDKQVIELPEDNAYYGLATSIQEIHHQIQSDNTDIIADTLLSHIDISDIRVNNNVFDDLNEEDEAFVESEEIEVEFDDDDFDDAEEFDEDFDDDFDNSKENDDSHMEDELDDDIEESSGISNVRALIGTQKGYSHKVYWEFGHPSLANRHMLIQGRSGQGKTYFIQRILKELSNQGIPSIIIDYTDGFKKSKLEDAFKESLGDKIDQHLVLIEKFPLNPFKRNLIELDDELYPENNVSVAGRFKSVVNSVYNFGDQQLNTIYNAVLRGLDKYGENMDLSNLKTELLEEDTNTAISVLNKLSELLDINPFESNEFDWSNILDESDGKVLIIQLTGLSKDIQKVISELILWDLWYYKASSGSEDKPFIVVLDEAHNLDFGADSPCSKILLEGRKFGWSGWFATQSIKGSMKPDEIAKLANAEEKIFFHPTDVSAIAKDLSKDAEDRKRYEKELSQLNKGYCIVQGTTIDSDGNLYHPNPLTVKIEEINFEKED